MPKPSFSLEACSLRRLLCISTLLASAWFASLGHAEQTEQTEPSDAAEHAEPAERAGRAERATRDRSPRATQAELRALASKYAHPTPTTIAGKTYYPYSFEGHVHSLHSRDADHLVHEILEAAEDLGLDAIVLTDHGSTRSQHDFDQYHGKVVPFVGQELGGSYGHAVSWNVPVPDALDSSETTLNKRADHAHEHGGLLVFAHPGWWINGNRHNPMEWMTPAAMRHGGAAGSIDALEIWNGVYRTPLPMLIDSWVAMLEAGVFIPIVGNSDFHRFRSHHIGSPRDVAYCDTPNVKTCLWPAIREGRSYITDGPSLVFTVNDKLPGAILQPQPGAQLTVRVQALAPEGGELRLYLGKNVVQKLALAPNVAGEASWTIAAPSNDSFLRVDILRAQKSRGQTPVSLLSNPVLLDVGATHAWR